MASCLQVASPGCPRTFRAVLLCLALAASTATFMALSAAPADAYYETTFCNNVLLDPFPYGRCAPSDYHHLEKVSANANSGSARIYAASTDSTGRNLNSDPVFAAGYVTKYLNGLAARGLCGNGDSGDRHVMDYCVEKF
jgi:hypothetical protein